MYFTKIIYIRIVILRVRRKCSAVLLRKTFGIQIQYSTCRPCLILAWTASATMSATSRGMAVREDLRLGVRSSRPDGSNPESQIFSYTRPCARPRGYCHGSSRVRPYRFLKIKNKINVRKLLLSMLPGTLKQYPAAGTGNNNNKKVRTEYRAGTILLRDVNRYM